VISPRWFPDHDADSDRFADVDLTVLPEIADSGSDALRVQSENLAAEQGESLDDPEIDRNEALRRLRELPDDDVPWRQR
jgi:hypothetical protein